MRNGQFGLALTLGVVSLGGLFAPACTDGDGGSSGGSGGGTTTTSDGGTGGSGASGGTGGADCGPGAALCDGVCTVISADPANCGACGTACADGEACDNGACVLECGGGATKCGGACVDTDNDPANCGACGQACEAGQEVCEAGQCAPACGSGDLTRCGAECVDVQSDAAHCGACGNACSATDQCVAGQCVTPVAPKGVHTMTNDPSGNQILSFRRNADGSLSSTGTLTPTGGKGTGAGLGNQHGLIFDAASSRFFAVNAGDHSLSMLQLGTDGALSLLANVDSGGERPISVTVSGDIAYVLHAGVAANGTAANITGFQIAGDTLTPIAGSTRPLSAANPNPAQIQFSPDGKTLVVTEKGTNMLDSYTVTGGVASAPTTWPSAGQTPFGFDFSANMQVIVSEAWGGQAGMSTASSYSVGAAGALTPVVSALPTTRTSACWLVVAGDHAYMANAMTNDITGFTVGADGALTLLDPSGVSGQAGKAPVDEDVTDDADFLYVVNNGDHSFSIFQINADGSLTKKPDFLGLPSTVSGIVAR